MPDINIRLNRAGKTASVAEIREHRVIMDRPIEKGGEDAGPMGGEALLAALGGCFMSNLVAAASARDIDLGEIAVHITGTLEGTPSVYTQISMVVQGGPQVTELPKLVTLAERGCIVANTLKKGLSLSVTTDQG